MVATQSRIDKLIQSNPADLMDPQEFLTHWPEITYRELSLICCCSESFVKHWFTAGASRKQPLPCHKRILHLTHLTWQLKEQEPKVSADIYLRVMDRRHTPEG